MIRKISKFLWLLVFMAAVFLAYLYVSNGMLWTNEPIVKVDVNRYTYQLLSDHEKDIYEKIVSAIDAHQEAVYLRNEDMDAAVRLVNYVIADYPEFYWVTTGGQTHIVMLAGLPIYNAYELNYTMDQEQREAIKPIISAAAESYLSLIKPGMSDYDKVKTIYDAIVVKTEYNLKLSEDQTIYNVLVNGEGVCSGYAKTMQYLLNKLGIFCTYVMGEIPDQGSHAWNLVRLDGAYYFVDPTWGDPVFSEGAKPFLNYICYDYFCITTDDLRKTHTIDTEWVIPECTATEANYFVKNGLYFDHYDLDRIREIVNDATEKKEPVLMFRFSNSEVYKQAMDRLFNKKDLSGLLKDAYVQSNAKDSMISVSYTANDDLYILMIVAH